MKKLMVLGGILAMLLVAAAPAFAQEGSITATGVLGEPYTVGEDPGLNYNLTDEASGVTYVLTSGFVDMNSYVGERVSIEGALIGAADGAPPAVNVTSLEPADGGPPAPEIVVITGALEPVAELAPEGPTHTITEYSTGDVYGLFSDAQGVDLSQYEGQSVAIYGIFQTQGNPMSNFADPTDVLIYVTSMESLEPLPVEPSENDPSVSEDVPPDTSDQYATSTVETSILPNTGGFSPAAAGMLGLLLFGGGLLAYGFTRQS